MLGKIKSRYEFYKILKYFNLKKFGVEIGVWKGNFSECLLETTNLKKIYSIDPWDKTKTNYKNKWTQKKITEAYEETKKKLKKFKQRSIIIKKTNEESLTLFKEFYFDFLYLDALHDYMSVKNDLNSWWKKIKKGGIMAGHDYCNKKNFGVIEAVDEFVKEKKLKLFLTKDKFPSWYFMKDPNFKIF